jgi:hypothetical protein
MAKNPGSTGAAAPQEDEYRSSRFRFFIGVARFRRQAGRIVDAAAECQTKDEAIELYSGVYDLLREVQSCLDTAKARLIELTPKSERFMDYPLDSGVLKFGGGKERTNYDNEALVGKFAEGIADNLQRELRIAAVVNEDGENIMDRWDRIIHATVQKIAQATGALTPSFNAWRSGVAKEFGIKLGDYAELSDSPVTVRIEGRDRQL